MRVLLLSPLQPPGHCPQPPPQVWFSALSSFFAAWQALHPPQAEQPPLPRALRHIETPATSATNNTAITITTISTGCIFSPIPPPRPSAPEGADSRVMPIFIGYSHAPRFVLIGVASRRIRRRFVATPAPAHGQNPLSALFSISFRNLSLDVALLRLRSQLRKSIRKYLR